MFLTNYHGTSGNLHIAIVISPMIVCNKNYDFYCYRDRNLLCPHISIVQLMHLIKVYF